MPYEWRWGKARRKREPWITEERPPWNLGRIRMPTVGLRDAVCREAYGNARGRNQYNTTARAASPIARTVRGWALGQNCTPDQWRELVSLIQRKADL